MWLASNHGRKWGQIWGYLWKIGTTEKHITLHESISVPLLIVEQDMPQFVLKQTEDAWQRYMRLLVSSANLGDQNVTTAMQSIASFRLRFKASRS